MHSAKEIVRAIRKARGETGIAFAEKLGVRQNTVSQYESGKVVPSSAVLFRLHQLAPNAAQKARVREILGPEAGGLLLAEANEAERIAAQFVADIDLVENNNAARGRFRDLCVQILQSGDIPLWLLEEMRLWMEMRDDPEARRRFEELFNQQVAALAALAEARMLVNRSSG